MKAHVLEAIGQLQYKKVERPACPKGWAIVKVRAAGICSSDIARVFTKGTYHFPTIPGHEFAGEVEAVGDDNDRQWVGRRVGVFPLIPCRECAQCHDKHYEMCEHYDYVGSRRDGGFAEYVAVPVWNLVPLADSITFTEAAMLEPLSVALHAMKRGGMSAGMTVGIIGTGMIGIGAGQWARMLGAAEVTVIGRSDDKRAMVERCGLRYLASAAEAPAFDFVLEAVGTPQAVAQAVGMTRPGGTVLLMGNPSGDITLPQDIYWRILRKQLTLRGTWNSAYDGALPSDWTEAVEALASKKVCVDNLVTHTFPQDRLMDGLTLMRDHREPYCKVMTTWND